MFGKCLYLTISAHTLNLLLKCMLSLSTGGYFYQIVKYESTSFEQSVIK